MRLRDKTISGAKWNTFATVNNAAVQMLKLFVLARLLSKPDFGLVAIAMMVIGFTDIFANLGLSVGLIHKKEISQKEYSSVFWINLIVSVLLFGIICACTPLLATYYKESELRTIIPLLGTQVVITAFGKMFQTLRTKELDFKFISIVSMAGVYISAIFTVVTALIGWGVYSLVIGMVLQTLIIYGTYALSGLRHNRILFHCNLREISGMLKIGGYQMGTQVLDYCAAKADIFLIGRFFGMEILGVYNLGKELVIRVISVINPMITTVATPAFAKIQDNVPLMRSTYCKILNILATVNFPIFALFFVFAEPLTFFLYGEKMMEVAFFLRLFAVWGLFQSVGNPAGILMVSLGRTDLGFRWTVVRIVCTLVATFVACHFTIQVMTFTQVALAAIFFFAYWRMMIYAMIQLPLKEYVGSTLFPLAAAVIASLPSVAVMLFSQNYYVQIGNAVLFGIVYVALFLLFKKDFVKEIWSMVFPNKIPPKNE